ncbi:hypothetical protein [Yoonia sediminilitoris]|uniref:Secreted protein n=1 Tax=Yoonia sediminilitoris TaxID=1286148 RepID=A0A2T6K7Y3_9RHOB|nr:hypothetical protein [Yoonia sediminilitoris]PUB10849.1 hypothetical protein C8N45_11621 [Yoonia sediminilitoris]RCW90524.1 hypothetical protein DFP92_11621 [Yoonia sediminilitoris]
MRHVVLCSMLAVPAFADAPVVENVAVDGDRISVTLSHPDTGWDHYADGWEVLDAEGQSLGVRVLAHPHVNEQPFTRSLGGVAIPQGAEVIFIRARDNIDGWSDQLFEVQLDQDK